MQLPFTTVDVFTNTPYLGNPLAIVRVPSSLRASLTEAQKQKIAREFNLSETTFLHDPTPDTAEGTLDIDIFSPLSRLTFAGHPTLGTALYALTTPDSYPGVTTLNTLAGPIPFTFDADTSRLAINVPVAFHIHSKRLPHPFPASNPSPSPSVPLVSIVKGMAFNLVPMRDIAALALPTTGLLSVEACYRAEHLDAGSGWDVGFTGTYYYTELASSDAEPGVRVLRTRSIGSREDPGTGSACSALCGFLALKARREEGAGREQRFWVTQGVEMGRRCDIFVKVRTTGDGEGVESVEVSGEGVRVMEGVLVVE